MSPRIPDTFIPDAQTFLADIATPITASGNMQVGGVDQVLDLRLGADTPPHEEVRTKFDVIAHLSGVDITSANETYTIVIEGSNDSTFATGVVTLLNQPGLTVAVDEGNVIEQFAGENQLNETLFRFIRGRWVLGGTTPQITAGLVYITKRS